MATVIARFVNRNRRIIKRLVAEPPDPENLKFVWTSTAVTDRPAHADSGNFKMKGYGVGVTRAEATAKAIGEALELYAASHCADDDLVYSTAIGLNQRFLDPRDVCLYYRGHSSGRDLLLQRFTSRCRIAWTQGQWLDTRESLLLPAFLTDVGARVSMDQSFAPITTSGLATSTSIEDAAMRAVCELVERDAFAITWLARLPARRIMVDRALDSSTRAIMRKFEMRQLEIRLYLMNAGIDIPVVLSLILGDGKSWPGVTVALGAHADPFEATRKAILEQALMGPGIRSQMLFGRWTIPQRAREIKTTFDHGLYYVPVYRARALNFLDSGRLDSVKMCDLKRPTNISLETHVRALKSAGARVAIRDLTPPDVTANSPFRVVRALATGLQPLWFGGQTPCLISPRLRTFAKNGLNTQPHPLA